MSEPDYTQLPLAQLADYLDETMDDAKATTALRWVNDCPDRFVATMISLGPLTCSRALTLVASALAITSDNLTCEPADVLRAAADAQSEYQWSELRGLLTRHFVDSRDA